jgi:integrase/recombinase XerD
MQAGQEPPNKDRKYPAEVLTADEVQALIGACSARSANGVRNRALIALLYRSGLRVSEIVALRPSDVDLRTHSVRVLHGNSAPPSPAGRIQRNWATILPEPVAASPSLQFSPAIIGWARW